MIARKKQFFLPKVPIYQKNCLILHTIINNIKIFDTDT